MPCLSNEATKILTDNGKQDLQKNLEDYHAAILKERVDYIEYGKPEELSDKRRAKLNCELLKQVLIHRADKLITATGQMLPTKNLYGMALAARGHIEAVAVLGYFAKRLSALSKGNIDFNRFELDIANGLMGAKHDLFNQANAPVNILTCVENADKHLDAEFFGERQEALVVIAGIVLRGEHVRHQVKHRGDFTLVGEDLGKVANPVAVLDLLRADLEHGSPRRNFGESHSTSPIPPPLSARTIRLHRPFSCARQQCQHVDRSSGAKARSKSEGKGTSEPRALQTARFF